MQPTFPGDPMGLAAMATVFGMSPLVFGLILLVVSVWTLAIKGYALWQASKSDQKYWFVAMLVLNTFGILEIVYLLFFRPKNEEVA